MNWRNVAAAALLGLIQAAPAAGQESAKDVIAAHIRNQGYVCDAPKAAIRQLAASRPDEQAWVLKCRGASYFVRLIPDMAAQVSPLP